jgi:HemY protein
MYQSLWGKAQSYLEASCSLRPSREALTALAQLAEKQDKKDEAFKYYHRAMELEFK